MLNKGFSSFEKKKDGKIKLLFDDNFEAETDYLIGADGINSKIRKQLFLESTIRYSGQTCWRGVANFKLDKEFEHRGMELWGKQVRFGISKISANKVYWFAVALDKPKQKDDKTIVKHKLLDMFGDFHPLVQNLITATDIANIIRNDINDLKPLKNWSEGNIALVGDAAHATTPNMGQGGAQAIEDAYCLGYLIANNPNQNVFKLFEQRRRKKVISIVKQSWSTGKMAHWKYGTYFRNLFLKSIPKTFLEHKMLEMYQIEK